MRISEIVMKYDEMLKEWLSEATEDDYWVCSKRVNPVMAELGLEIVEDRCVKCGAKVYRRPHKSRAKVICEDCWFRVVGGVCG